MAEDNEIKLKHHEPFILSCLKKGRNLDRLLRAGSAPKITKVGGAGHKTEPKETQPIIQDQGSPGSAQRREYNSRAGQPV